MSLVKDEKTIACTVVMKRALAMTTAELHEAVGLRNSRTAASDADVVDMEFIDTAVSLAEKHLPNSKYGFEFNVGKLSKIHFKLDPKTFPTPPSAHSKLMSAARWLVKNRSYTMPVKEGAERSTIAYPPLATA
jgi:hypothetical protein